MFCIFLADILRCTKEENLRASVQGLFQFNLVRSAECHEINFHDMEESAWINAEAHISGESNHTSVFLVGIERPFCRIHKEVHSCGELFDGKGGLVVDWDGAEGVFLGDERSRRVAEFMNE